MQFEKVRPQTKAEMIVQQILENINKGDLKPGDKLPTERDLSHIFGVGRSSIREAIKALSLMGYLEVIHGTGAFLKSDIALGELNKSKIEQALDAVNLRDLMEAREMLELKAIELATGRARSRHLEQMRHALDIMAENDVDTKDFVEADMQFHLAVAKASDNLVIEEMMKSIVSRVLENHRAFVVPTREQRAESMEYARRVVEGIAEGQAQDAQQAMLKHLDLVIERFRRKN